MGAPGKRFFRDDLSFFYSNSKEVLFLFETLLNVFCRVFVGEILKGLVHSSHVRFELCMNF